MTTPVAIVNEARSLVGTPWMHQASLKDVGCDCVGVLRCVARVCLIQNAAAFENDQRFKGYGTTPNLRVLIEACNAYLDPVPRGNVRASDILLLKYQHDPMHFAIVSALDPMYIVHALGSVGHVAEHRVDPLWESRIVRAYRFRGVA